MAKRVETQSQSSFHRLGNCIVTLQIRCIFILTLLRSCKCSHLQTMGRYYAFIIYYTVPEEPPSPFPSIFHTPVLTVGSLITFTQHHLCHSATLTNLINQRSEKKPSMNNWPIRWHFLTLIYETVSLCRLTTHI